ncbi:helix-turn-helix transcriptional regulator [Roseibium suaedae]|uniref:DNA-binding transcriptional regulator, CsgD family n=1 Tax=Roseibium suaedae TaxID=735517 RepID=A0A1M7C104_9HYPH|nr:helix-turn-helix transcriptional regulator [Roseibium suaedae]SHL60813.1 DNA-binding transcriptional regulator, CsgD family [Roseibium suaedae]
MSFSPPQEEIALQDSFFEAALAPENWTSSLERLSDYVGGGAVNLILIEKAGAQPVDVHYGKVDEFAYTSYIQDYISIDPRIPRVLGSPVNTMLLEHQVLTEEERQKSAIYNDLMSRSGMRNQVISLLAADDIFGGFGVAPARDADPFSADQISRLSRQLTSLKQAVRVYTTNRDLQLQRNSLGDLWSKSGKAVLLFDAFGQVLFANSMAEHFIRSGVLKQRHRQIGFADRAAQATWIELWARMRQDPAPRSLEFLATSNLSLEQIGVRLISAEPLLSKVASASTPALVMVLTVLSGETPITQQEVDRFCQLFGITQAESRVVCAVANGLSLAELAVERNVSNDTLRKQLKTAMAKCGVTSQKALISRLERFCFLTQI